MRQPLAEYRASQRQPEVARAERRARLQALAASDDWKLVAHGLRALQVRTMETVATGSALSEAEIREHQSRYRLLGELLTRPVEMLTQFDDAGDEG